MKIGFVLDDTLDSTDGVQQYVLTLGNWLSTVGHEVHYLVGETKRDDLPYIHSLSRNIKVRFNGNRMSMPLPARRRGLVILLAREQFDILHVQVPYSPLMAGRLILAAPKRTAIIGTFHIAPQSGLVRQATILLALWARRSLTHFDAMLSVSTAAQLFAKQTYGTDSRVLPNVVVTKTYQDAMPYPFNDARPTIVFLGRLVPRKGCMVLLQAIEQLHRDYPTLELRVVICGRGPLESELKQFTVRYKLDNIIQFVGYITEADKPRYLKAADLAVFPSSGGESFGIVLLEAMSADRPVVLAAANPGYATVLADNPNLLFPINDPVALAIAMRRYLFDIEAQNAALQWQRTEVPKYNVAMVGRQLLAEYQQAIQTHLTSRD